MAGKNSGIVQGSIRVPRVPFGVSPSGFFLRKIGETPILTRETRVLPTENQIPVG